MISNRLKTIASFIDKKDKVIDIGADHALLSIYLYQNKLCKSIAASDNKERVLKNAIANIKMNDLEKKIPTIISDGFENINVDDFDTAIIAGMGRTTITNILDNKKSLHIRKFIIQTNNEHAILRKYMASIGYYLKSEKVVYERKKYYILMEYIRSTKKNTKAEIEFGLVNETYKEYYENILLQNTIILNQIPKSKIISRHKLKQKNKKIKNIIRTF